METASNDEQMVERALSGDPEAFGEIVRRWERRIFALAFGMLGREEDARDATQETFLSAFRNLRNFRSEAALEDEAEKNAAVFALPLEASPARAAEDVERSIAVRRAVATLPPDL